MSKLPLPDLGAYLREQRESAQLSLRQLAEMAGVSNPYLSQIERGLKRPSAEILQQIAKGLQVSAESLYVRAGILDERVADGDPAAAPDVLSAIAADPVLTDRQRAVLVDIYVSFVGEGAATTASPATSASNADDRPPAAEAAPPQHRPSRSRTAKATPELNEKEN
ncbi:helix-turn-helix transcriptional regulator [Terrabacter sp. NPDC080008]|uniref:helix-turn-helix domain-containing protein n=1 Tax=Terrabacter sp. NPDC080008 TaxID=3155176 RepID=UPI00344E5A41